VLLLDVEMPGTPTLSVISRVAIESPPTRILIVTMHRDRVLATQMLNAGAIGFLSKAASSEELVDAIRQAQHRQRRVPPPAAKNQILSQREVEVLRLIAEGKSNADIAGHLSIAIGTVKRHNSQIFTKLGASSRTDALRRARRLGELADDQ
jgi:DNA-binding NarL/FixJ family response regulator